MTQMSKHKAKAPQRRVINREVIKIYNLLNKVAKEELAKKNAKKLREKFRGNKNYNSHNPCTEVDLLVDELENPTSVLEK